MGICLHHVKTIICNQSFPSLISSLYVVKKGDIRETYPVMDHPIHGEHNGESLHLLHYVCT